MIPGPLSRSVSKQSEEKGEKVGNVDVEERKREKERRKEKEKYQNILTTKMNTLMSCASITKLMEGILYARNCG